MRLESERMIRGGIEFHRLERTQKDQETGYALSKRAGMKKKTDLDSSKRDANK